MRVTITVTILLLLGILSAGGVRAGECPNDGTCQVKTGEYMVYRPAGLTGRQLPVLMHFHGYRELASDIMAREDLKSFADRHGVLLVVPQGQGATWSHPGAPTQLRDEFRFVDEVVDDLEVRYGVDRTRFLVSGFSQGSAMVWNLACYRGEKFAAFVAIAGTFWTPQPDTCPSGAQTLLQIHGVEDRTVPLEGRVIAQRFRQGDVFRALGMMRRADGCAPEDARTERNGALVCETFAACASGKRLELCLHAGGHDFDATWLDFAWRFMESARKG